MVMMQIQNLCVGQRLQQLDLEVHAGEMTGLIGPNGAGKSTLLNTLAGLEKFTGSVNFEGAPLANLSARKRAQKIGLLTQHAASAWALSVADIIGLGRLPWGDDNQDVVARVAEQTGVKSWLNRPIDELSGGEKARVWLARVLAGEPQLLLADEPLASLDLYYQCHVMSMLRYYAQHQHAVVVSIHDLSLAARYCDRLCLLHEGHLVAMGTPENVLTRANIQRVYQVDSHIDLQAIPPVVSVLAAIN